MKITTKNIGDIINVDNLAYTILSIETIDNQKYTKVINVHNYIKYISAKAINKIINN